LSDAPTASPSKESLELPLELNAHESQDTQESASVYSSIAFPLVACSRKDH